MLEPKEIDALIAEAWGGEVSVSSYSLEIEAPTGFELAPDMYFFLGCLLRAYGDACAAEERERATQAVIGQANALSADLVDDGFYAGYRLAIRNAVAAIRVEAPGTT